MPDMTITYDDGTTHDVDIKPADMVAFERKYGMEWAEAKEHPKIEHPFFMAWNYLRRTAADRDSFPDFDTWLDKVADMDADEPDEGKATPAG